MRSIFRIVIATMLLVATLPTYADDLEDAVRNDLTPTHFQPSSVLELSHVYVIKRDGSRLVVHGDEIRRVHAQAIDRGIQYSVLDFHVLQRLRQGSIVTVVYRAKVSQAFEREHVVIESISHEQWEHRTFGWVLICGTTEELAAD